MAQKDRQVEASRSFVTFTDGHDKFLNKIVIGDESLCFWYCPSTKRQTEEWQGQDMGPSVKVRGTKSNVKKMSISGLHSSGIVHSKFCSSRPNVC